MNHRLFTLLVVGLLLYPTASALANWQVNANAFFGKKTLNELFDWEVSSDLRMWSWPINIALGYSQSQDYGQTDSYWDGGLPFVNSRNTREYDVGLKKIWEPTSVYRLYADGGIAVISVKEKWSSSTERDTSFGYWVGTGFFFELASLINAGLEMRYSRAEMDMTHHKFENFRLGLIVGLHFEQ